MREIVENQKRKHLLKSMEEAAKKKSTSKKPPAGIKINKTVLPEVGMYLSEYFWQDLSYNLGKELGDMEKASKLVNLNKDKIEAVISKMAANTNMSISPKTD